MSSRTSRLQLVPELVSALRRHAPRLASVSLRMRADLVSGPTGRLPAGALLQRWAEDMRQRLAPDFISFDVVLDPGVHTRRCVFVGPCRSVEVCSEWGLSYFREGPRNLRRPAGARVTRRTNMRVME